MAQPLTITAEAPRALKGHDALDAVARVLHACGLATLCVTLLCTALVQAGDALALTQRTYIVANTLLYAYVILHSRRGGVSLLVSFFFLFFIAIPAHVQISSSTFPYYSSYTARPLVQGYVILCIAQLSYAAGEIVVNSRSRHTETAAAPAMRATFYWKAVLGISLSSLAVVATVGIPRLLLSREERSIQAADSESVWQQLLLMGRSISLLGTILAIYLLTRGGSGNRRPRHFLAASLMLATSALLNYPPGLPRFQLLGALLAIGAVLTSFFGRVQKLAFGVSAPAFLLYFFPAIKALGYSGQIDLRSSIGRDVQEYLTRVDFDGFKQIVDTWIYTQSNPLRLGENFLGVGLFWVPRSLWETKPVSSGHLVSGSLGYSYTNVSNPLPAEGLISFGYIGTCLVLALAAIIISAAERASRSALATRSLRHETVWTALLMGYIIIILRGSLNGVAPMFLSGFLLFAALIVLHNRTRSGVLGLDSRLHHPRRSEGRNN